ncbi:phosphate signaling complex protein PhoU [Guptibacillus hwajinpoensis]|uniref:Phosphate-specific transport system accessory protein PhoU n=1 Tax=Guptibacillus hwajinpoensis TaxID=208199 RepID=A0A0J6D0R7_9BACL|nr:phosphate signaling complex protein PhoU [Alkalihalobacillus macyae]KMM37819.1 PhoU family transcriptional regulator [Alkalihalobacillus macyae]MDP4550263.1 phosphate signaling complex protein PhoU [Alkalihalobacillus macyae]
MVVRENFQEQLDEIKSQLLELGSLAQISVDEAITALKNQDVDKALEIIENDNKINRLEEEINERAIWLIAKEQPLATDLRRLISALKITTDVERVGDLAVNIAKSIIRIGDKPFVKPIEEIPALAQKANNMLREVLASFYDEDVNQAMAVADADDEIDNMYGRLVKELLELMTKHPESVSQIQQLSFICRYIERIGDHCTNISESVIYVVKGKRYDLNA